MGFMTNAWGSKFFTGFVIMFVLEYSPYLCIACEFIFSLQIWYLLYDVCLRNLSFWCVPFQLPTWLVLLDPWLSEVYLMPSYITSLETTYTKMKFLTRSRISFAIGSQFLRIVILSCSRYVSIADSFLWLLSQVW